MNGAPPRLALQAGRRETGRGKRRDPQRWAAERLALGQLDQIYLRGAVPWKEAAPTRQTTDTVQAGWLAVRLPQGLEPACTFGIIDRGTNRVDLRERALQDWGRWDPPAGPRARRYFLPAILRIEAESSLNAVSSEARTIFSRSAGGIIFDWKSPMTLIPVFSPLGV
jgi:hypothetical protein